LVSRNSSSSGGRRGESIERRVGERFEETGADSQVCKAVREGLSGSKNRD